jgi:hypothetical protein
MSERTHQARGRDTAPREVLPATSPRRMCQAYLARPNGRTLYPSRRLLVMALI